MSMLSTLCIMGKLEWIKGSLVNFICEAKLLSKQMSSFWYTYSSKAVQWTESMPSKLATFPIHWVGKTSVKESKIPELKFWCFHFGGGEGGVKHKMQVASPASQIHLIYKNFKMYLGCCSPLCLNPSPSPKHIKFIRDAG